MLHFNEENFEWKMKEKESMNYALLINMISDIFRTISMTQMSEQELTRRNC